MKQEQLEKKIEEQLVRFEHAIELPINTETGERMSFVRDGIVNASKYLEAPVKILWILKEAHSDDDSLPQSSIDNSVSLENASLPLDRCNEMYNRDTLFRIDRVRPLNNRNRTDYYEQSVANPLV
jgi:2-hydroxychromene-2-carboxylate isomerase